MDVWGQLNVGNQAHPAAWHNFTIRLFQREPEMRRLDPLAHFLRQFGEKLSHYIVRREPIGVLHFEILFTNNAARVDKEKSGMRHPLVLPRRFHVQDAEAGNDLGTGIGE